MSAGLHSRARARARKLALAVLRGSGSPPRVGLDTQVRKPSLDRVPTRSEALPAVPTPPAAKPPCDDCDRYGAPLRRRSSSCPGSAPHRASWPPGDRRVRAERRRTQRAAAAVPFAVRVCLPVLWPPTGCSRAGLLAVPRLAGASRSVRCWSTMGSTSGCGSSCG